MMNMEYIQSMTSLAVVALMILIFGWLMKKLLGRKSAALRQSKFGEIQILSTVPLDTTRQISLVSYGSRRFLVIIGKDHESVLGQWEEAQPSKTDDSPGANKNEPAL